MKTRLGIPILLLAVVVASPLRSPAQAQGFNAVYSQDGYDVWAVGDAGAIFRSLDRGVTWGSYPMGSADHRGVAARGNRVWIVDAAGKLWRSEDGGYSFTSGLAAGGSALSSVCFLDPATGWIAGEGGAILHSNDGGATWTPQISGTGSDLFAVRFKDTLEGWACGSGGVVLRTADGGATWFAAAPVGSSRDLYDLDFDGSTIYVAGSDGFLARSSDSGSSWTAIDLRITSRSNVNGVAVTPTGTLWLCGGGGFLRRSADGGQTFSYPRHPVMTGLTDVFFFDANHGWACAGKSKLVARTSDGGATWSVPGGGGFTYAWSRKLTNPGVSIRGHTFAIDPVNRDKLYCVQGKTVYASWDIGDTWSAIATIAGAGSRTNAFLVSASDTNTWLALVQDGDRVTRTTDGGANWTNPIAISYTEYGLPLEQDADRPDHVYFGPEDGRVWKSTDFGATWSELSNPGFRSPDDIVVVPDTTGVFYVSDGVTGVGNAIIWKSSDGGHTWVNKKTVAGSEVPMMCASRLDRTIAYATDWPSGGVQRSLDLGESWPNCASTSAAWGVDIAKDDPNVAMYSVYSGATTYLTLDRGLSFHTASIGGSNYGLLAYDRGTFLCHQSDGVWKATISQPDMPVVTAQTLGLVAPNGGEVWQYRQPEVIAWTCQNIPTLRIEVQMAPAGPWETIAASASAPPGTFTWLIPNTPAEQARIRLSDVSDGAPFDESAAPFRIVVPSIRCDQTNLDFVQAPIGAAVAESLRFVNEGTATLAISSVALAGAGPFTPTRTSFSIPPGGSDTIGVIFEPIGVQSYEDTLVITSDAPQSPTRVIVTGKGTAPVGVSPLDFGAPAQFALREVAPNPFGAGGTVIAYTLPEECEVRLAVYNVLGQAVATLIHERQRAGHYAVRFPGAERTIASGVASILPSGIYFFRLEAGRFEATRRMVMIR